MNSAVYEGWLTHRRLRPHHSFAYRVAMPLIDLAEIDQVVSRHPLWSSERRNAVSFRRADFLGDPAVPLDQAVRDLVESRTGTRPSGRVLLLAHLRTWGWLFNPIALYLCTDPAGSTVEWVVVEVTNTPWHETHSYVVAGGAGEQRFPKELHVSPFFGMDQAYCMRLRFAGDALVLHLANEEHGETVFRATLSLHRREMNRSSMGHLLWRFPLMTVRVSAGIYIQALRLLAKGAPVSHHPDHGTARMACPARPRRLRPAAPPGAGETRRCA